MLRSEFDSHPLWAATKLVIDVAAEIREQGEVLEIAKLETILFYAIHAISFTDIAATSSALFSREMLDPVNAAFQNTGAALQNRVNLGPGATNQLDSAMAYAEASLVPMAPWPRPYGKGGQVTQMNTLFEGLLEAQRLGVIALSDAHVGLRLELSKSATDLNNELTLLRSKVTQLETDATTAVNTVDAEKVRIDDIVRDGLKSVATIEAENTGRYKLWTQERESAFSEDFSHFTSEIESKLQEASESLEKLRSTNEQFENLSAIAAGEVVAASFAKEAKWGRTTGIVMYSVGGLFLAAATVPLVWLLFEGGLDIPTGPRWGLIAVRLAIGALAGSAATVAIRLGGRLMANANASKRMELDLRSIGPFLANVNSTQVDSARIALVDRAFGQAHTDNSRESTDDKVPVAALGQVIELITKYGK